MSPFENKSSLEYPSTFRAGACAACLRPAGRHSLAGSTLLPLRALPSERMPGLRAVFCRPRPSRMPSSASKKKDAVTATPDLACVDERERSASVARRTSVVHLDDSGVAQAAAGSRHDLVPV